jgi:hypothetical protein
MKSLAERFAAKVLPEPNSGCWLWAGSINPDGYGKIRVSSRPSYSTGAHRVSWELVHGPVPPGLEMDHLCRVRCCVNPQHLAVVTRSENQLRSPLRRGFLSRYHERSARSSYSEHMRRIMETISRTGD